MRTARSVFAVVCSGVVLGSVACGGTPLDDASSTGALSDPAVAPDPSSRWHVIVESVNFPVSKGDGSSWDPEIYDMFGSINHPPDPWVMAETDDSWGTGYWDTPTRTQLGKTEIRENSHVPHWNQILFTATAAALMDGFALKAYDADGVGRSDYLGGCTTRFDAATFSAPVSTVYCAAVGGSLAVDFAIRIVKK